MKNKNKYTKDILTEEQNSVYKSYEIFMNSYCLPRTLILYSMSMKISGLLMNRFSACLLAPKYFNAVMGIFQ